jgi:hypothetical protein
MTIRGNPVRAPALAPVPQEYTKPAHGGLLRAPWQRGQTGNPGGRNGTYWETVKLARDASPEAMQKLIALMSSDDERVASVAANGVLDRAWGKPKDYDPKEATNSGLRFDIAALSPEERSVLLAIIRRGAVKQATGDDDTNVTTLAAAATETRPA